MTTVKFRQIIRRGQVGSDVLAVKRSMQKMNIRGSHRLITSGRAGITAGDSFVNCVDHVLTEYGHKADHTYGPIAHKHIAPHFDAYGRMLYRTARIRKKKTKFVVIHNCPVPSQLAPYLRTILNESGASLISAYRGSDATALLHQLGKRSQEELYYAWTHRYPGANPANPPGFSTHELFNDGYAYRGRRGEKLQWWQCGLDLDNNHVVAFENAAARHGWRVTRTYPYQGSEYHHVNFRQPPMTIRVQAAIRSKLPFLN